MASHFEVNSRYTSNNIAGQGSSSTTAASDSTTRELGDFDYEARSENAYMG